MKQQSLIIFTRYPEPGKAKTRLIPCLGEEGAAELQRQMAERTLKQVGKLLDQSPLWVEIHFTGGSQCLMADWLGGGFTYRQQQGGDLGERMLWAFRQAFLEGRERVVAIGTDCPALDEQILAGAFQALEQSDLVLGPAVDGGYYLIGLSRLIPELFAPIPWGTGEVLAMTQQVAETLGLKVAHLPLLQDVDFPQDLAIWQKYAVS